MDAKTNTTESALLQALTPQDRETIEGVLEAYPQLTAAEAIDMSAHYGGLHMTVAEARELLAKHSS